MSRTRAPASPFISSAQLTNVVPVAQGLEFHVYKAESPKYGTAALRIPQHKVFHNVNDPSNDARELIVQELGIYRVLHGGPVPVPQAFELLEAHGYPAMLSEYIEHDGTEVSSAELGRMAALIHSVKMPKDWDIQLVAMEGGDVFTALVNRIVRRFEQLVREEPSSKSWIPERHVLQDIAQGLRRLPPCLLHMDLRDVNLRMSQGKIAAVLDWTNCLFGPAAVDFYRIMELGKPGDDFVKAYSAVAPLPQVSAREETFLRLDAALMISLVFISEAPDEELRGPSVARVEELAKLLQTPQVSPRIG
jgi:aminoglycoside phosphotransferase (APT) family kinase protein